MNYTKLIFMSLVVFSAQAMESVEPEISLDPDLENQILRLEFVIENTILMRKKNFKKQLIFIKPYEFPILIQE